MCGISGIVDFEARDAAALGAIAERMAARLVHRGPDDRGVWLDPQGQCALSHRRLSVLDLSAAGRQPMVSASERSVLSYNGEIYNYRELAEDLRARGHRFRGHSDTEVLLAACDEWGVRETLERSTGMFAFGLWDRRERTLTLARDRLGEKPLYWTRQGPVLAFASEIHALVEVPGLRLEIDRDALAAYLRFFYVPAPYSVYRDVHKLEPGAYLTLGERPDDTPRHYWRLADVVTRGREAPFAGDAPEAAAAVEARLEEAVRGQLQADVPVGAFLSGGIDSSTVVALMQRVHSQPVKTFTIGFHEPGYDEAAAARRVAAHLGTEHRELYVTADEAMAVIPKLPAMYSEPFADVSQIPTFLVSELAREEVTVSLTGDGGDELFGGYNRYHWGRRLWSRLGRVPAPLRSLAAGAIHALSPEWWRRAVGLMGPLAPRELRHGHSGEKLHKLAGILRAGNPGRLYLDLVSAWSAPETALPGAREAASRVRTEWASVVPADLFERMMYVDTLTYLPDDILVKVDRASMAVSLETRTPMLDHGLVELAWSLPHHYKLDSTVGKKPLRAILDGLVPRELWNRPKAGFTVPMGDWLRGPLRDWAEPYLAADRLESGVGFDAAVVRNVWERHLSGRENLQYRLWPVIALQAWLAGETTRSPRA